MKPPELKINYTKTTPFGVVRFGSVRFSSVRIGSRTVSQNLKYRRARNAIETNEILRQQPSPGTNVYGILNIIQRI
jgi:hypothetical protein